MTRENLKDDLTRILLADMIGVVSLVAESGPMTEARMSILCSRPARNAAERVVQELERLARVKAEPKSQDEVWNAIKAYEREMLDADMRRALQSGRIDMGAPSRPKVEDV